MFVAFMPFHILMCEVLLYFILRVELVRSLNLNQNGLKS
jgi:hypothetical protein